MQIAPTALRTAGNPLNKNPGSNAGVFTFRGESLISRGVRRPYIFRIFLALPSKISARSLSLIGAAFSHFVPSALLM